MPSGETSRFPTAYLLELFAQYISNRYTNSG